VISRPFVERTPVWRGQVSFLHKFYRTVFFSISLLSSFKNVFSGKVIEIIVFGWCLVRELISNSIPTTNFIPMAYLRKVLDQSMRT
jgi:hypothetical protein